MSIAQSAHPSGIGRVCFLSVDGGSHGWYGAVVSGAGLDSDTESSSDIGQGQPR